MNRIEFKSDGTTARLKIRGAFDEKIEMPENLKCKTVVIDMEEMTQFNSMGVRIWLTWIKAKKGFSEARLENCRSNFVKQMNVVNGMLPSYAKVISFYVPYYSPETEEQVEVKFTWGKEYDDEGMHLPNPTKGGKPLELDVDESYFKFIKNAKKA